MLRAFCPGFKTDFWGVVNYPSALSVHQVGMGGLPHLQFQVSYSGQLMFSILSLQGLIEDWVCNSN